MPTLTPARLQRALLAAVLASCVVPASSSGASRLTRKGKALSARLALRLDRSLAGERLRLEVEAVDVRGIRQLERNAGSIRVAG